VIDLAEALDVPIQVFHVSSPAPAEEIARARKRGLRSGARPAHLS
jgi:hypothetical protein